MVFQNHQTRAYALPLKHRCPVKGQPTDATGIAQQGGSHAPRAVGLTSGGGEVL